MNHLHNALNELGEHAGQQGVPLFYERSIATRQT